MNDIDIWNLKPGDVVLDGEGVLWDVVGDDGRYYLSSPLYSERIAVGQAEYLLGVLRPVTVVAVVAGAWGGAAGLARYLPSNYGIVTADHPDGIVIAGSDVAGWTFADYVQPRLASGLMGARRIERDSIAA